MKAGLGLTKIPPAAQSPSMGMGLLWFVLRSRDELVNYIRRIIFNWISALQGLYVSFYGKHSVLKVW